MARKSSTPKSKSCGAQETQKLEKHKEPHLSGAYIRSLVKQLTSSNSKERTSSSEGDDISSNPNFSGNDGFSDGKSQPPQQHKKQVRRRLHTSRPYQERLLNMAEARREIVTALKCHRAAMKQQANEKQLQEIHPSLSSASASSHHLSLEEQANLKSRTNPRIYASSDSSHTNFSANSFENNNNFSYSSGYYSPYSWPVSVSQIGTPPPPMPYFQENLNFPLPNQTLGLSLNLQDFTNLDTSIFHCNNKPSSIYSSSSSSALPPVMEEIPCMVGPTEAVEAVEFGDLGLHPAMDDKEMAEIRSIGEQHQLEWDDTVNFATSACWFKFLKAMKIEPEDQICEDGVTSPFDDVVEFPAWLNANGGCLEHLDDYSSDDYLQDPALSCMDIEEIEGIDADWLA